MNKFIDQSIVQTALQFNFIGNNNKNSHSSPN
jgi:hypothetical protein